ncbi:MAG: T9SS type A sorting domain-containing protein [Methanococcaceae archaeon]
MKSILALIFLFITFLFSSNTSNAQWQKTNGIYGGDVRSFGSVGQYIFAGTLDGGIYRSSDKGDSWMKVSNGSADDFVVIDSVVYAGTGMGIFRSSDYGNTWSDLNTRFYTIWDLAVKDTCFYASTWGMEGDTSRGGCYLSTDKGISWKKINNGLTNLDVRSMAFVGDDVFAGTMGGGVFVSTDQGSNWSAVNNGLTNNLIYTLAAADSDLFAGTYGGGVFRSTDEGKNWFSVTKAPLPPYIHKLFITRDSLDVINLYAGCLRGYGVFLSTDKGNTWTSVNTDLTNGDIMSFYVSDSTLFAGTTTGIFSSSDKDFTWTQKNYGITNFSSYAITSFSNDSGGMNLFSGTSGQGFFYSSDFGINWTHVDSGFYNTNIMGMISFPDSNGVRNILAASNGNGIFRSTNDGQSWANIGFGENYILSFAAIDNNIYAGCDIHGVFLSTDYGANWKLINNGLTSTKIYALAANTDHVFAGTESNGIFVTTDGENWSPVNNISPGLSISSLAVSGSTVFAGIANDLTSSIYISTDNGANWKPTSAPPNNMYTIVIKDSTVFAGSGGHGVYISKDFGKNWKTINEGLDEYGWDQRTFVTSLNICGDYLIAGTRGNGLWRRPLSEVTSVKENNSAIPTVYSLEQNYPNPFNPSTRIKYSVSVKGLVTIKLYDLLGREAAVIVNEEMSPGIHEVTYNAQNLTSGVYFYQLRSGASTITKKMILIK